jgi:hypothetical protein
MTGQPRIMITIHGMPLAPAVLPIHLSQVDTIRQIVHQHNLPLTFDYLM